MALRDRGPFYSSLVAGAKVILPLVALGLLATLFLFGRGGDGTDIPFSEIEAIAREPRMTAPSFAGATAQGGSLELSAEVVRPIDGDPSRYALEDLSGRLEASDGSTVTLAARRAEIDPGEGTAAMAGLVRLTSSAGFEMEATGLDADLATGTLVTRGALEARAPYGQLTAGGLTVTDEGLDGEGARMDFTGGVRLLYDPAGQTGVSEP